MDMIFFEENIHYVMSTAIYISDIWCSVIVVQTGIFLHKDKVFAGLRLSIIQLSISQEIHMQNTMHTANIIKLRLPQ